MKTKEQVINEIVESGANYVSTRISPESCAASIAISDIENVDDSVFYEQECWWQERFSGLDDKDY